MIKIGCVSIDVSHPKVFASGAINDNLNMRYTHVVKESFRTDEELNWFKEKFNLEEICQSVEEMADKADVGFVHSCNWEKHLPLAKPFIDSGKPVFIDKPLVGTVKDVAKVREYVKNGAKILGASAVVHGDTIREFLAKPIEERGEILSIYGVSGTNEFDYSIHIVEAISALAQSRAVSNTYIGSGYTKDGAKCENFALEFENGIHAVYSTQLCGWMPFTITVVTTKGAFTFDPAENSYNNFLKELCDELTTGKSRLSDIETILNACEIMICGKKSRDELNGKKVTISDLCEDDGFDGNAFEEYYERTANRAVYTGE